MHTGNGKGKTSAAMGIVMRGAARGWRVAVFQGCEGLPLADGGGVLGARSAWTGVGRGRVHVGLDGLDRTEAVGRAAWTPPAPRSAPASTSRGARRGHVPDQLGWIALDEVVGAIRTDRPT